MNLSSEITRGLKALERACGQRDAATGEITEPTFTWRGKEIPCSPTSIDNGLEIDTGENSVTASLRLFVRREHFLTADSTLITMDSELYTADDETPVPVAGRKLLFRGMPYRIISAKESGVQSHFVLILADASSNR